MLLYRQHATKSDKPRRVLFVVPMRDLASAGEDNLEGAVDRMLRSSSVGLLLLLPRPAEVDSDLVRDALRLVERRLVQERWDIAVYACFEDEAQELLERLQASTGPSAEGLMADEYIAQVGGGEPEPLKDPRVSSFVGHLKAKTDGGAELPNIVVVAHYDTLSAFPALARGETNNGGGAAALLELARLFSKLYNSKATVPRSNIIFILTGGGRLNYAGAKAWVNDAAPGLLHSVDYVLCLESLPARKLHLLSNRKKVKDDAADSFIRRLFDVARTRGIPVSPEMSKLNMTWHESLWEFEHFAHKRLAAGTLSSLAEPQGQLLRGGLADPPVDLSLLRHNVAFLAEVLLGHVHGVSDGDDVPSPDEVFNGSFAINERYLQSVVQFTAQHSRSAVHNQKGHPDAAPIVATMRSLMQMHLRVKEEETVYKTPYVFYNKDRVFIEVHASKSTAFCTVCSGLIGCYLLALHFVAAGSSSPLLRIFT